MQFLRFYLWGPMAAWGTLTVGSRRTTEAQPTRSAVLGLVANSLGYDRNDEDLQTALAIGLGFAVRTDQPGILMDDYHTIQAPPKTHRKWSTRRGALAAPRTDLNTLISKRQYLADQVDLVVLWRKPAFEHAPTLETIAQGLRRPARPLALGRKSCPVGNTISPEIVEFDDLRAVLVETPRGRSHLTGASVSTELVASVDQADHAEFQTDVVTTWKTRDQPIPATHRQFRDRLVGHVSIKPTANEVIVPVF